MSCRTSASRPKSKSCRSPVVANHALAGIAAGDVGEFAFEGGGGGPAVAPFQLGGSGRERGVACLRGAVDDKARARQRLEGRRNIAIRVEVMGPGNAAAQGRRRGE